MSKTQAKEHTMSIVTRAAQSAINYKAVYGLTGGRRTADLAYHGSCVAKDANVLNLQGRPGAEGGWALQLLRDADLILEHAVASGADVGECVISASVRCAVPVGTLRERMGRADVAAAEALQ